VWRWCGWVVGGVGVEGKEDLKNVRARSALGCCGRAWCCVSPMVGVADGVVDRPLDSWLDQLPPCSIVLEYGNGCWAMMWLGRYGAQFTATPPQVWHAHSTRQRVWRNAQEARPKHVVGAHH